MVHAFDSVQVALVHCVDPQIPGAAVGFRTAPLPDRHLGWTGRLVPDAALAVGAVLPQPVQLRHRERGQSLVLLLPKVVAGPLQEFLRGRPAERIVGLINGR